MPNLEGELQRVADALQQVANRQSNAPNTQTPGAFDNYSDNAVPALLRELVRGDTTRASRQARNVGELLLLRLEEQAHLNTSKERVFGQLLSDDPQRGLNALLARIANALEGIYFVLDCATMPPEKPDVAAQETPQQPPPEPTPHVAEPPN